MSKAGIVFLLFAAFVAGYWYSESNRPPCTPGQVVSDWFWGKSEKEKR